MTGSLGFPEMAKIIRPQIVGVAEVRHYTITKLDVLRELMHGGAMRRGNDSVATSDKRKLSARFRKYKAEGAGNKLREAL